MAAKNLFCWKCGASLEDIPLPFSRYSKCKSCHADLHVCRMCEFYDPTVSKKCREPIAEEVKDKTRANFCGYLQPAANAYTSKDSLKADKARSELEGLFGLESSTNETALSEPDVAKQKLEELFGINKKD